MFFFAGLSKRTTTEKLHEEFAKFGEVVHARVVTDRVSGYSKGFGFVKYATLEDAAKGIEGMDGKVSFFFFFLIFRSFEIWQSQLMARLLSVSGT
ncbi:hypothetical protein FEM48_Zijuj01G0219100 [Ziziphus jujuba var. spinosa]|uniref:RRM domain-containing protein n=1 Tax=Ziziphus jujuba var. spinosa TaxID=714518 RepID=A0A978W3S3_ZIZJJ|nr:hypothetical protein FEM48_Zijuj01G0219100 [Ziziphus jujuba var. spinosa]